MFRGFIASLRAPVITVIRDPVRRWDKKHTLPACRAFYVATIFCTSPPSPPWPSRVMCVTPITHITHIPPRRSDVACDSLMASQMILAAIKLAFRSYDRSAKQRAP
jgi:hypothetical protein